MNEELLFFKTAQANSFKEDKLLDFEINLIPENCFKCSTGTSDEKGEISETETIQNYKCCVHF
jgi:hypothetical protein